LDAEKSFLDFSAVGLPEVNSGKPRKLLDFF